MKKATKIKKMLVSAPKDKVNIVKLKFAKLKLKTVLKKARFIPVVKKGKRVKTQVMVFNKNRKIKEKFNVYKKVNQQNNVIKEYKINCNKNKKLKTFNVFKLTKKRSPILKTLYLLLIGIFIGFVNGFWGGGGGMICVPTLTKLIKLKEKTAHATTILIMLPLSLASFIVYTLRGNINWNLTGFVTLGFVAGGVVGAMLLKKINNIVLKIIFSLVIIAGAIKLLIS